MKVKDPVCGMEIEAERAAARVEHEGRTYYFCSNSCRDEFKKNPKRYAHGS
jgi:Cu+-exporting ATPase